MIGNQTPIPWFSEWLSTSFDKSKGRVIVHLPAAGKRLRRLKRIILQMVEICEESRIAIEFHVTSADGESLAEEEAETYRPNVSVYSINSFFHQSIINQARYKYGHQIIIRRIDIPKVYELNELPQVDIVIFSFHPEEPLSGRWSLGTCSAINEELISDGLIIRTANKKIDFSSISYLITNREIPIDKENWYDVWKKK